MRFYIFLAASLHINSVMSWTTTTSTTTIRKNAETSSQIYSMSTRNARNDDETLYENHNNNKRIKLRKNQEDRRQVLERMFMTGIAARVASTATAATAITISPALAEEGGSDDDGIFVRETKQFAYSVKPPTTYKQTSKPVKTHLDEINFVSETVKGCQFGITIDPVRINSLKEVRTFFSIIRMFVCLFFDVF